VKQADIIERAESLLAGGQHQAAVDTLVDAAKRGDGEALYKLALWYVFGHPVARSFATARALLERARATGHRAAATTLAVFVAMGAGGPLDWRAARTLLEQSGRTDPVAEKQCELLDAMLLDHHGMPPRPAATEILSRSPRVAVVRKLFTPKECSHVIALARDLMRPSFVVDSRTGHEAPHPVRTSDDTVLGPIQQDLVTHALNLRIAAASGTRIRQGEPLAVLRYRPGQEYRLHHDCLPGEDNQRELTLISYLNSDYDGGATHFPAAAIDFRGEVGDAVLFANMTDGRIDERSRHAGLPVSSGEKWVCTRWIRMRDFDPWGAYPA